MSVGEKERERIGESLRLWKYPSKGRSKYLIPSFCNSGRFQEKFKL